LQAIQTNLPGVLFSQYMAEQAKIADRLTIVRSIHHSHCRLPLHFGAGLPPTQLKIHSTAGSCKIACGPAVSRKITLPCPAVQTVQLA